MTLAQQRKFYARQPSSHHLMDARVKPGHDTEYVARVRDCRAPAAARAYFAAAGYAGSFSMSRASCWMMTFAFRFSEIFLIRSIDATVWARS